METEKETDPTPLPEERFRLFAIVELMGRQTIAGLVEEVQIAGKGMLRVDVPAVGDVAAFTKYFSPTAVYAITPVSEATATEAANKMRVRPVQVYVEASRQLGDRQGRLGYDDNDY